MCGIVGALCFGELPPEKESQRQEMMRIITTELMRETEPRGEDATGAAILFEDGRYFGVKRGEKVSKFFSTYPINQETTKDCYASLLDVWRSHESKAPVRAYLGHCRKGTVGEKEDNNNNHPIKIGNLVGIHNGVIRNDYKIFDKLGCKRDGKVDTEAIFRLFEYFTNHGKEPFTTDMIQSVFNRLEGAMAVMVFNADNPWQVPLFRDGRPAELVFIKELGLLFIFSEYKFWTAAHSAYERTNYYYYQKHNRLPTLINSGGVTIERKTLQDDSSILFDLTVQCDEKTTIDDIGEYKKLSRTEKIWQNTVVNTTRTATSVNNTIDLTTKTVETDTNKSEDNKKKYRVFDAVTRTYRVKIGDIVLDEGQGAVVKTEVDANTGKNDVIIVNDNKKLSDNINEASTEPETKKVTKTSSVEENKDVVEEKASSAVTITDHTNYNKKGTNVIDVSYEMIEDNTGITTVDMQPLSPEILSDAENAFKSLPNEEKGFESWEDATNKLEFKDESAKALGNHFVCNRVFRYGWIKGYIAAKLSSFNTECDKDERREKHIVRLKSLVMLLVGYFIKTRQASKSDADRTLKDAVLNHSSMVDMNALTGILNSYERDKIKATAEIISDASKYRG